MIVLKILRHPFFFVLVDLMLATVLNCAVLAREVVRKHDKINNQIVSKKDKKSFISSPSPLFISMAKKLVGGDPFFPLSIP
jgi:hypothetical protein